MSKTTFLAIGLGVLQTVSAFAAEVWRAVPNTGTEMDVQTEGYPVCAYTANNNDTTVNGVLFTRWMSAATFGGDDITFSPTLTGGRYNGYYTLESGTAIATLLGNAAYAAFGSGRGGFHDVDIQESSAGLPLSGAIVLRRHARRNRRQALGENRGGDATLL